jgi:hypothetical protein
LLGAQTAALKIAFFEMLHKRAVHLIDQSSGLFQAFLIFIPFTNSDGFNATFAQQYGVRLRIAQCLPTYPMECRLLFPSLLKAK